MLVPSDRVALGSSHIHEETKISSEEYLWCVQINYTILKSKLSSILLYFWSEQSHEKLFIFPLLKQCSFIILKQKHETDGIVILKKNTFLKENH